MDKQLKWNAYEQLQQLLKCRRFARAIALVEGLAQRIPLDPECASGRRSLTLVGDAI
jgi:hypothetical protein